MSIGFSHTSEIRSNERISPERLDDLTNVIQKHTGWNYTSEKTKDGYCLNPIFRNMQYHNSFVPKIDIAISQKDGQSVLHLTGQPVELVQNFTIIFCGFALAMQVLLLIILVFNGFEEFFPFFVPILMCAFGYFLCRLGTKYTFQNIVKAIEKEFQ